MCVLFEVPEDAMLSPGLCFCFVASRLLLRAESLFSKTLEIESWMVTSNKTGATQPKRKECKQPLYFLNFPISGLLLVDEIAWVEQ